VIDQSLILLNDHVLNAESAVRENTAQLRFMASSVESVREIPKKTEAVEQQLAAAEERLEQCVGVVNKLWERLDGFERSAVTKLTERMEGIERSVREVAGKPAEWAKEMDGLRQQMRRHAELFEKPQEKRVYHRHYLHYYGWITLALAAAVMGLAALWNNAREDARRSTGNDLLWRGAWQMPDSALHEKLMLLKNQCDTNSGEFRRHVLEDEARDEELTQKLIEQNIKQREAYEKATEANEKQQEADAAKQAADELKKQKKRR